jgi:FlaA1/EpsC-like NDP-sugar epimerase
LAPDRDIEIRFTGVRPGEKLSEQLSLKDESAEHTRHPQIFIGRVQPVDGDKVGRLIAELAALADCSDPGHIRAKFQEIVPEYGHARPPAESGPQTAAEPPRPGTIPVVAPGLA